MRCCRVATLVIVLVILSACATPAPGPVPTPSPSPPPPTSPQPAEQLPLPPLPKTSAPKATEEPGQGQSAKKPSPAESRDCGSEPIFTASPLDIDRISYIVPLGNLNPPSHTFPTDHIYFHITRQEGADRTDVATLYSPGDLTITGIRASEHVNAGFADYNIFLEPCDDITVMFYHASSLSQDIFGDTSLSAGWTRDSEYTTGGETYRLWNKKYQIKVRAGDIIGTAGGNPGQWALDLGVYDRRYVPDMMANPGRWAQVRYQRAVCPLSLYEKGPELDRLIALVQRDKVESEEMPCGSVLQDIPGTSQGIWFLSGTKETYPEDPHLALVRSNIHPGQAVFSVGNSVLNLNSGTYEFLPENSGRLNRDFPDITPDGQIYAFQVNGFGGIIILHMPDSETLWFEALAGATADPESRSFTENKTVFIR